MNRLRLLGRGVSAFLVLVAATGCIGYEEHVTFTPSGGGTFQLKFGFDMTFLKSFGEVAGEAKTPTVEREPLVEQFGEDVEIEELSEEIDGRTYEGFRLKIGFDSPEVFSELAETVAQGAAERADEETGRLAAEMTLAVTGQDYALTGVIPPLFEGEKKSDPFARLIFGTSRRVFVLTLPGRVTAANADSRDGQTYTWRLDPLSDAPRQISATWVADGNPAQSVDPVPPVGTPAAGAGRTGQTGQTAPTAPAGTRVTP